MNVRPETIKLIESMGSKFLDISLSNDYFGSDSKSKGNKSKNKQVGLHQTKMLLHSKGNHQQNEKATYWMGENICKLYIWQGVNIQNI